MEVTENGVKINIKNFIAATKKYTDLQELDATVLREFIDKIYIFAADGKKGRKKAERKVHIVYNFIGAFDFGAAAAQAETAPEQVKTA